MQLEREFEAASKNAGLDLCAYRVFADEEPAAAACFNSAAQFQKLVSLAYDSKASGHPKLKNTLSQTAVRRSTFNLSFCFAGSVGFVLSVPNERLLLGETLLDDTMHDIFQMLKLQTTEDLRDWSRQFGIAVVRELSKWVGIHVAHGLGVDLDWRRGSESRDRIVLEQGRLQQIIGTISQTSDVVTEEFVAKGTLIGADVAAKRFRFLTDQQVDIRGGFEDAIDSNHQVTLPKRYQAWITSKSLTLYSTEEDRITYFLSRLEPLS